MTDTPEIARIRAACDSECEFELADACDPPAMSAVLAHIDAQAAEIERLSIALIAASEGTKDREYAEGCFIRAEKLLTADERTLHAEIERLRADALRYQWLAPRLLAADFDWNESGKCVLIFDWPETVGVGGNCDKNIDAAMKEQS